MPIIRKAVPADSKALSELAESTFRATFSATNSAEQMALHSRSSYGERIQAAEIADPGVVTLLAEDRGCLIGYAQLRWSEVPGCVSAQHPAEIQRLYVAEEWHGKGVAQALMNACIAELQKHGADAAWLGVWEHNPRAISFYRKFGFVEVGDHTFHLGSELQRDVVMVRSLAPEAYVSVPQKVEKLK